MSLLDKYAEYKSNASQRGNTVTRRYMDPDFLTPDVFFMMDEIKGGRFCGNTTKLQE